MDEKRFLEILARILNGDFSKEEFVNFYNNILRSNEPTDEQREKLIEAIERRLREKFPQAANRIFGQRDGQAREWLQKLADHLQANYDLSKNNLGNHVKTGGDRLSGKAHIDVYLSYKNERKIKSYISVYQGVEEKDPRISVGVHLVSPNAPSSEPAKEFSNSENGFQDASLLYEEHLKQVLLG